MHLIVLQTRMAVVEQQISALMTYFDLRLPSIIDKIEEIAGSITAIL
jgi:hypothetical protein